MKKIILITFIIVILSQISIAQPPPCCPYDPLDQGYTVSPQDIATIESYANYINDFENKWDIDIDGCENDPSKLDGCVDWSNWAGAAPNGYKDVQLSSLGDCFVRVYFDFRRCISDPSKTQYRINNFYIIRGNSWICDYIDAILSTTTNAKAKAKFLNNLEVDLFREISRNGFERALADIQTQGHTIPCDGTGPDVKRKSYLVRGSCVSYCIYSEQSSDPDNNEPGIIAVRENSCADDFCCSWKEEFCMEDPNNTPNDFSDDVMRWTETVDTDLNGEACSTYNFTVDCPVVDDNNNPLSENVTPTKCINSCDVEPLNYNPE